jgi:exoribonuclease R
VCDPPPEPDEPIVIRGKLRVLPGTNKLGFVACDRGLLSQDVVVADMWHRNRALDGDIVYVQLLPLEDCDQANPKKIESDTFIATATATATQTMNGLKLSDALRLRGIPQATEATEYSAPNGAEEQHPANYESKTRVNNDAPSPLWQDDEIQMDLWNPQVPIVRRPNQSKPVHVDAVGAQGTMPDALVSTPQPQQRRGRVVHVLPPKSILSELDPSQTPPPPRRRIVGSLLILPSGTILLTPNQRSLPQFKCFPQAETQTLIDTLIREQKETHQEDVPNESKTGSSLLQTMLFQAEYEYGSWKESFKNWPPAVNIQLLGRACVLQDEIQSLLMEHQVDHGDFPPQVLKDVNEAVQSGVYLSNNDNGDELSWKPTPEMYARRRDYRDQRIFTIDPTTAKDLDDALHITALPNGLIEVGVHIADVSYFVQPNTAVNDEAIRRSTTVYLVDRSIPMLPRPLCEVACSLNENVERLAFSCVWTMNPNGTLRTRNKRDGSGTEEDVWYGRTVIKSCARLDYATAQNIIDNKVARPGDSCANADEALWPSNRRPTGGHTMEQVAADVRLMHRVAMARRQLRFENGALALHSVKLTFQLDTDGQSPLLAAPYPIRDSNRLVEEYMLLANYLVAQRLITHAGDLACLRHHPPPKMESMDKVAAVAKAGMNFDIDISSSQTLHQSLVRLGQVCRDDPLVLTCVTQMLTLPMQQAQYFAAGS